MSYFLIHAEFSDTQRHQKWPQKPMSRLSHLVLFTDSHLHGISSPAGPLSSHLIPFPRSPQWAASAQYFGNLVICVALGLLPMVGVKRSSFPLLVSHLAFSSGTNLSWWATGFRKIMSLCETPEKYPHQSKCSWSKDLCGLYLLKAENQTTVKLWSLLG